MLIMGLPWWSSSYSRSGCGEEDDVEGKKIGSAAWKILEVLVVNFIYIYINLVFLFKFSI
jgi:hypothetical protein